MHWPLTLLCRTASQALILLLGTVGWSMLAHGQHVKAQTDYVITVQQDTLYGDVREPSPRERLSSVSFKEEHGKRYVQYTTSDLLGYGVKDSRHYRAYEVVLSEQRRKAFLLELVSGRLSIFYLKLPYEDALFFALKEGTGLIQLSKSNYRSELARLSSDCEQLEEGYNQPRYDRRSIIRTVSVYNACFGDATNIVKFQQAPLVYQKGIILGANQGRVIDTFRATKSGFSPDLGIHAGAFLSVYRPPSRLTFYAAVTFAHRHAALKPQTCVSIFQACSVRSESEVSVIRSPLLLKFYLLRRPALRVSVDGGGSVGYALKRTFTSFRNTRRINPHEQSTKGMEVGTIAGFSATYSRYHVSFRFTHTYPMSKLVDNSFTERYLTIGYTL